MIKLLLVLLVVQAYFDISCSGLITADATLSHQIKRENWEYCNRSNELLLILPSEGRHQVKGPSGFMATNNSRPLKVDQLTHCRDGKKAKHESGYLKMRRQQLCTKISEEHELYRWRHHLEKSTSEPFLSITVQQAGLVLIHRSLRCRTDGGEEVGWVGGWGGSVWGGGDGRSAKLASPSWTYCSVQRRMIISLFFFFFPPSCSANSFSSAATKHVECGGSRF